MRNEPNARREQARDAHRYPWLVRCTYGRNATLPRREGDLAIETQHKTLSSARMDFDAGVARDDIGHVSLAGPEGGDVWRENVVADAERGDQPEVVVTVSTRTWEQMRDGAEFESWPGGVAPAVGERVTVFDKHLDFTQHDVVKVDGARVWIGPAIPWRAKAGRQRP